MKHAAFPLERFTQPVKVGVIVFFTKETGLAIVAPLNDVQGDIGEVDARAAGHGGSLAKYVRLANHLGKAQ